MHDEDVVREILREARDLIERFGWRHGSYSLHGAAPRCIRKAVWDASVGLSPRAPEQEVALQRISEAIYDRPGVVGGINDWEYRKRTDKAAVLLVLGKAIAIGLKQELGMP